MKFDNIKVYATSLKMADNTFKIGIILSACLGKDLHKEKVLILDAPGCTSKLHADLYACFNALQCIRPEFRNLPVRFYIGQNTAYYSLERDGTRWIEELKAYIPLKAGMRKLFLTYSNATIHKFVAMMTEYKWLSDMVRSEDGMERD
jgi:hypothetical protein